MKTPNLRRLAADPRHQARLAAMRADLDAGMKEQGDAGRVFETPRLLPAEPAR
ncbi:MAG: hypothetical protein HY736_21520 [Verrucomicrobia bacterium]|nr:hypothetical protein [Verrucomicrobiota bacterium]